MRMELPVMRCDDHCGECCGIVPCKDHDFKAVVEYAREHGVEPQRQGVTCPWYQQGRCQVYPVRPYVCRLFGHVERLVCCKGYNANIAPGLEKRLNKQYGKTTKTLHEVFPDWGVEITRVRPTDGHPV